MTEFTYDNYREVLEYEYQQEDKQPKTFLQIAKQPHYENVISNILAFFLDTGEEHGLKDLFLSTLIALIEKKGIIGITFSSCTVEREVGTNQGRIDILIKDMEELQSIIVENKIYHHLSNNLGDYFDSVEGNTKEKAGVLLSRYPHIPNHPRFVNITHQEYCQALLERMGKYYTEASDKYLFLLKDYIQNIQSLYPTQAMKEEIVFYLDHLQKISRLTALNNKMISHVFQEIEKAGNLHGYQAGGKRSPIYRYWVFEESSDFYYTIFIEDLVKGKDAKVEVVLEFRNITREFFDGLLERKWDEKYPLLTFAQTYPSTSWVHFAWRAYPISHDQMLNLGEYLYDVTQKDFEPLKDELLTILTATQK